MFKIKVKLCGIILVGACAFLQSGCSTLAPSTQSFRVNTNTQDARIFVNGSYMGKGSIGTKVPRDRDLTVVAEKDGYQPYSMYVGTRLSRTGMWDALGSIFILPIIGLVSPGAQELDTDRVSFYFPPDPTIIAVSIPNSDGTTTSIQLTRQANGYVGPQGEYYESYPTVEQLKVLYGK